MRASFACSSVLLLITNAAAKVINDGTEVSISNPLIEYKQCSSGDEEWRICLTKEGRVDLFCPTVPTFDFSQVNDEMADDGSDYSFSNITSDCFTCANVDNTGCETFIDTYLKIKNMNKDTALEDAVNSNSTTVFDRLLEYCQLICEGGKDAEECSLDNPCTIGTSFCDYNTDADFDLGIPGICKACPSDLEKCYEDGFVTSRQGQLGCHHDCRMQCHNSIWKSTLTINGEEFQVDAGDVAIIPSFKNVSGPLADCSNLLLINEFDCPGAKDHVCVLDMSAKGEKSIPDYKSLEKTLVVTERNGCVAVVLSGSDSFNYVYGAEINPNAIPFVTVQMDGDNTLQVTAGDVAQLQIQVAGTRCTTDPFQSECNNFGLRCGGNQYCEFNSFINNDGEYTEGSCVECPAFGNGEPNPTSCFFPEDVESESHWSSYRPEIVESCAISCDASLGKLFSNIYAPYPNCHVVPYKAYTPHFCSQRGL